MAEVFRRGADNPKDPIRPTLETADKELLKRFSEVAHNFGSDAVIIAATSIFLSAIRQVYPTRAEAEKRFDEAVGKTKQTLMNCYDGATGKRLNIFPHAQTMYPALAQADDKFLSVDPRKRG